MLKGVNYFPRGHAWYRMLYDWYSQDCATTTLLSIQCVQGAYVYQLVEKDLQRLADNKINFIHLYLWDQDSLAGSGSLTRAGFLEWDNGGPENSPHDQWRALEDFVSRAEAHGILLHLEFAATRPLAELGYMSGTEVGNNYAGWVSKFIDYLTVTKGHHNVVIWGVNWPSGGPASSDPNDPYVPFWKVAYTGICKPCSAMQPRPGALFWPLMPTSAGTLSTTCCRGSMDMFGIGNRLSGSHITSGRWLVSHPTYTVFSCFTPIPPISGPTSNASPVKLTPFAR